MLLPIYIILQPNYLRLKMIGKNLKFKLKKWRNTKNLIIKFDLNLYLLTIFTIKSIKCLKNLPIKS